MRILRLTAGDIRFQMTYGFWFLYAALTFIYLLLLSALPVTWRKEAAALLIFSDPAAIGLFFMGACILLEKSQRVIQVLALSPVRIWEYMMAKAVSFALISLAVAAVLACFAGFGPQRLAWALAGTLYGSLLFSFLGMAAASGISSLNQYLLVTVPIEMICFVPPVLYLLGIKGPIAFFPTVICLKMLLGTEAVWYGLLPVSVLTLLLLAGFAWLRMKKMWSCLGGVKL